MKINNIHSLCTVLTFFVGFECFGLECPIQNREAGSYVRVGGIQMDLWRLTLGRQTDI